MGRRPHPRPLVQGRAEKSSPASRATVSAPSSPMHKGRAGESERRPAKVRLSGRFTGRLGEENRRLRDGDRAQQIEQASPREEKVFASLHPIHHAAAV